MAGLVCDYIVELYLRFTSTTFAVILACLTLSTAYAYARSRSIRTRKQQYLTLASRERCGEVFGKRKNFWNTARRKIQLLSTSGQELLDSVLARQLQSCRPTNVLQDRAGRPCVVQTTDPEILNAVLVSNATDYGPSKARRDALYPLAQQGLLLTDGAEWHNNRKLIVRRLDAKMARHLPINEPYVLDLFDAIGNCDEAGWTAVVDCFDLFRKTALDMSTAYLFGTSTNLQSADLKESGGKKIGPTSYFKSVETIRRYFGLRSKLGSWCWMADSPNYRRACATLCKFADQVIEEAIKQSQTGDKKTNNLKSTILGSLLEEVKDPLIIRHLVVDLFIAGQNMTGTTAAWVFAELGRRPDIFARLRKEVVDTFGAEEDARTEISWERVQTCTLLQNVIRETLRLYPLVASISRNAKTDTVLPRGGGQAGTERLAIPKGAIVTTNVYLMHRRESEWGSTALNFDPDRWTGREVVRTPGYAPFGRGPRQCVGQLLSVAELSYLLVRLLQRFEELEEPVGQDNLGKGYEAVLMPRNGVKLRFKVGERSRSEKQGC